MRWLAPALALLLVACCAGEPIEDHRFHVTYSERVVFAPRPDAPDGLRLWIQNLGPGPVEVLVVPRDAPATSWRLSLGRTASFALARLERLEMRLGTEPHAAIEWAAPSALRACMDIAVDPDVPPAD